LSGGVAIARGRCWACGCLSARAFGGGERQADEDAEHAQQGEVLVFVEAGRS